VKWHVSNRDLKKKKPKDKGKMPKALDNAFEEARTGGRGTKKEKEGKRVEEEAIDGFLLQVC
jgi:hypothetical protein